MTGEERTRMLKLKSVLTALEDAAEALELALSDPKNPDHMRNAVWSSGYASRLLKRLK